MVISRRGLIFAATAAVALPLPGWASRRVFIDTLGVKPSLPEDVKRVPAILANLPTDNYLKLMQALANLGATEKPGSTGEPWNRRWREYANPLLVHIWNEMGYQADTDCTAWCGVTLGWCLKRTGIKPPPDCASSQAYLNYFKETSTPQVGDICVFTNYGDATHGHVTIFENAVPAQKAVRVVGANQSLSIPTNCPGNVGVNVVDERVMALKTAGHFLNKYVRPA